MKIMEINRKSWKIMIFIQIQQNDPPEVLIMRINEKTKVFKDPSENPCKNQGKRGRWNDGPFHLPRFPRFSQGLGTVSAAPAGKAPSA